MKAEGRRQKAEGKSPPRPFSFRTSVLLPSAFILLPSLASLLLRLLNLSLRWRTDAVTDARIRALRTPGTSPFILALWHNRLLVLPFAWERYMRRIRPRAFVLTSMSQDGEWLARLAARFGFGAARGSARRRGPEALRELVGLLRDGHDVAVTPDGSKGPVYGMKGGLVLLAQLSGARVVPVSVEFSRAWRLRSWDGFFIPKPFARVELRVGEPFAVPPTAGEADFERARARAEAALLGLVDER